MRSRVFERRWRPIFETRANPTGYNQYKHMPKKAAPSTINASAHGGSAHEIVHPDAKPMAAVKAKAGDTIYLPNSGPVVITKRYTIANPPQVELHFVRADGTKGKVYVPKDKEIHVKQGAGTKLGNAPKKDAEPSQQAQKLESALQAAKPVSTAPGAASTHPDIRQVSQSEMRAISNKIATAKPPSGLNIDTKHKNVRAQQTGAHGAFASSPVRQAWGSYIGGGYGSINKGMRSGKPTDAGKQLQRAYRPPPATALPVGKVYRGVAHDRIGYKLKPGDAFRDDGFVSTSHGGKTAHSFSNGLGGSSTSPYGNSIYTIKPTAKTRTKPVIAGTDYEREWILPPGSSFKVTGITEWKRPNGIVDRHIEMDWVD